MELYRKFLILFVIICFTYIIFRFIQKRRQLFDEKIKLEQGKPNQESFELEVKEGFFGLPTFSFFPTKDSELSGIQSVIPPGIVNLDLITSNLPISQYVIKSSYNTPFTGSFVNLDAITYVLSRGCRFIDIELYMVNNVVVVAQSTDPTNMTIGSKNTLLLDDVLNTIALNAFTSPSPNPMDPLFLQLRIKSTDPKIYKYTAMSVKKNLNKLLYSDRKGNINVKPSTLIGDLMGSIILIIDKKVAPAWSSYPECTETDTCYNLSKYANMIAGQPELKTANYINILDQATDPYTIMDDTLDKTKQIVDITNMKIITPPIISSTINNPEPTQLIQNYGVQIICYQYFNTDYNLANYEMLFSDNKSAFVSFAQIHYMK
jgi:hypothetical protein